MCNSSQVWTFGNVPVSMSIKAAATIKVSRDRCSGLDVVDEGISLDVRHIPAVTELPAASRQVERHNTGTVL